ncbi:zinc ribbon domain-containing protein [Campylobacter sputorum subsp. bubulus]|uniref:Zinc ribbon domain-containing protein n=1 Tax=Campylobacter sputorum subsp. sputorum TaxID=32024 RepID=A0A381DIP4_9BACT|nr:zinc ribbon domain protein (DUF164 domain) [Campylobacter sputorum aubsp. sputorum RM3237]ASM37126.1 zinc ribbon domain protein (DUF164 domain) [Campylobacter sputorum bv. faecalis CCUG 20703]KAB0582829.1 hypothetical protein F7P64_01460 [Campylobacter sputorum subsp. sputorum]SUX08499.1 zinc ribbon domain-containing protein [Campylobacter sputorum subsp. bubulus]QEL05622.1 zinc ribbon domain-containing protein (DUF164 domain) [Campylobacter sputorum subsp. sputorum]
MNIYLQQLVELSKIDAQIDSFEPRLKKAQKELAKKQDEQKAIDEKIENIISEIKDINSQQSQTNIHIAEFAAKIKEISKKSSQIKTDRESKALKIEEDVTKEQLDAANDDMQKYEKLIENRNALKDELEIQKKEILKEIESLENNSKDEIEAIEKDRKKVYDKKDKLISKMNQKILSFYEKVRKWAGNTSVVQVKKQACYGCFMKINDKTYASVLKGDDIITCPHCGRILYVNEANDAAVDVEQIKENKPKKVSSKAKAQEDIQE